MPVIKCNLCSKEFYAKPYFLKIGQAKYCSAICQYEARKKGRYIACNVCGKETYKQVKQLTKSKSGKFFCSKSCQTRWRNTEFIGSKHANYINGNSSYKSILNRHKITKICNFCGVNDPRILAVHHIDEDHHNNILKNLTWLCHNCHFLVHHDSVEKAKFLAIMNKK